MNSKRKLETMNRTEVFGGMLNAGKVDDFLYNKYFSPKNLVTKMKKSYGGNQIFPYYGPESNSVESKVCFQLTILVLRRLGEGTSNVVFVEMRNSIIQNMTFKYV